VTSRLAISAMHNLDRLKSNVAIIKAERQRVEAALRVRVRRVGEPLAAPAAFALVRLSIPRVRTSMLTGTCGCWRLTSSNRHCGNKFVVFVVDRKWQSAWQEGCDGRRHMRSLLPRPRDTRYQPQLVRAHHEQAMPTVHKVFPTSSNFVMFRTPNAKQVGCSWSRGLRTFPPSHNMAACRPWPSSRGCHRTRSQILCDCASSGFAGLPGHCQRR
jgi:hypothetical protein